MKDYIDTEIFIPVSEAYIFSGLFGVLFESVDAAFYLGYDVSYAVKVDRCGFEFVLSLCFSAFIQYDSGSLLKDLPSVLSFGADYICYLALADDGVSFDSDTGIHEELADIPESALIAVDKIFALARPEHAPCYGNFVIFERQYALRVVYDKSDFCHSLGFSGSSTRKNDILHLGAAELL